jgi:hypothetical protein
MVIFPKIPSSGASVCVFLFQSLDTEYLTIFLNLPPLTMKIFPYRLNHPQEFL